jgi:hypothetical protein
VFPVSRNVNLPAKAKTVTVFKALVKGASLAGLANCDGLLNQTALPGFDTPKTTSIVSEKSICDLTTRKAYLADSVKTNFDSNTLTYVEIGNWEAKRCETAHLEMRTSTFQNAKPHFFRTNWMRNCNCQDASNHFWVVLSWSNNYLRLFLVQRFFAASLRC